MFIFVGLWAWIGFVSSIDTALTIHLKDGLKENERNPIARLILEYDGWEVSRFIGLKMFGTIVVLGILLAIYNKDEKYAFTVAAAIALFQSLLLLYLIV